MDKTKDRKADGTPLMVLALAFYTDRPDIYLRDYGTNRIVRQTHIWNLRVERGLEGKR